MVGSLAAALVAAALTPQQQAALVVVSGLPAPRGVGGVLVRQWNTAAPRPKGALVFVDQEGGEVRAFRDAPPSGPASSYRSAAEAAAAGRATRRALRRSGVHVDLAPVLDLRGPLGSRHFRRPELGLAFARGLGDAACVKHFPGLGTAAVSTDERPHVDARVRELDLAPFRAAIRSRVRCVMTSNAFYDGARYRASISPETYTRLRRLGFDGVAITDSLSIVRTAPVERWSRQAIRAGADLLLFTSPAHARRAIAALTPLARAGELDAAVGRVLRFRRFYGLPPVPE
jgi:beta-glucosidase-like glycosyl hydrolase